MTADDAPANPSVLDTTVLSNFATVDQVQLVADLARICGRWPTARAARPRGTRGVVYGIRHVKEK